MEQWTPPYHIVSGNYKVERHGKTEPGTSRCPFTVCRSIQSCEFLEPDQMVHTTASTQKTGTGVVDLGPGRGQRRPNRRHGTLESWALEPADSSLVEECGTPAERRGSCWAWRGRGAPGGRGPARDPGRTAVPTKPSPFY